jgi:hypothetical protein
MVRVVLFDALAAALGEGWSDELRAAFHAAYDMITEAMLLGGAPTPRRIGRP